MKGFLMFLLTCENKKTIRAITATLSPSLIAPTPKKPQAFLKRRDVAASARDG